VKSLTNLGNMLHVCAKGLMNQVAYLLLGSTGCIKEAKTEAAVLLQHCLHIKPITLAMNEPVPVTENQLLQLRQLASLRVALRLPLQYALGWAGFRQFLLQVTPSVLCPRPETEELVELLLQHLKQAGLTNRQLTVLEVGTGSGAIAIALKYELPEATVMACDVCPKALAVAKRNSRQCLQPALEPPEPILFFESDLLSAFPAVLPSVFRGKLDVLVANLPYISPSHASTLQPEVLNHEPHKALFAEEEGKALILALLKQARPYLNPGATVWLELSPEQIEPLHAPLTTLGYKGLQAFSALNGQQRFLKAEWGAS
jgi:release factor glutamine methyltransferase